MLNIYFHFFLYHGFLTFSYNFCHFPLVLYHGVYITQVIVNGFEYFQIFKFESRVSMQVEQCGPLDVCVRRYSGNSNIPKFQLSLAHY